MTETVIQTYTYDRNCMYTITVMIQDHTQAVIAKTFLIRHTQYSDLVAY